MDFCFWESAICSKEIQDGWALLLIHTNHETSGSALWTLVAKNLGTGQSKVLLTQNLTLWRVPND